MEPLTRVEDELRTMTMTVTAYLSDEIRLKQIDKDRRIVTVLFLFEGRTKHKENGCSGESDDLPDSPSSSTSTKQGKAAGAS